MLKKQTTAQATLVIDGHVHIYPQYDRTAALTALLHNLHAALPAGLSPQPPLAVGLLTESKNNRFYDDAMQVGAPLAMGPFQVSAGPEPDSLVISEAGLIKGYLIAGRQFVTRENLEILSLGKSARIPERLPLQEALQAIKALGGVPVLSWSPGKWFFKRGRLVRALLEANPPDSFLIGDIGLRPTIWPLPRLMEIAARLGFRTITGSDALPLPGEERWLGKTGCIATGPFNLQAPATSLREILSNTQSAFQPIGKRSTLPEFISRWGRNQKRSV